MYINLSGGVEHQRAVALHILPLLPAVDATGMVRKYSSQHSFSMES